VSYIITATIPIGQEMNRAGGVDELLANPKIRLLHRDSVEDLVVLDVAADFDTNKDTVRWLCRLLVDAGILEFNISHSF
jgi:hypothetical protein